MEQHEQLTIAEYQAVAEDFREGTNEPLIYVPRAEMVRVLRACWRSLVPCGAILMSMSRGQGEGYIASSHGYRYVTGWEYATLAPCMEQAGFEIIHHYYRPRGLPCAAQSWIVMVAHKS